jgi:hypothetical protein
MFPLIRCGTTIPNNSIDICNLDTRVRSSFASYFKLDLEQGNMQQVPNFRDIEDAVAILGRMIPPITRWGPVLLGEIFDLARK